MANSKYISSLLSVDCEQMESIERERKIKAYELKRQLARVHSQFTRRFNDENKESGGQTVSRITARLYLGSKHGESDRPQLKRLGISHILSVGNGMRQSHPTLFQYHSVDIFDLEGEDILAHVPQCISFMSEALTSSPSNRIFVHCQKGISRSTAIVIAFLMIKGDPDALNKEKVLPSPSAHRQRPEHLKMSYREALEMVKERRNVINPNIGFQFQLRLLDSNSWAGFEDWGGWSIERLLDMQESMGMEDDRTLTSPTRQEPAALIIDDKDKEEGGRSSDDKAPFAQHQATTSEPQEKTINDELSPSYSVKADQSPRSPTSLECGDGMELRESPPQLVCHPVNPSRILSPMICSTSLTRGQSSGSASGSGGLTSSPNNAPAADGRNEPPRAVKGQRVQTIPDKLPSSRSSSLERKA